MNSKKMLSAVVALCIFTAPSLVSQALPPVEILPGKLIFVPLGAYLAEPRTGVRKELGSSRLKLDIGSALDVVEWRLDNDGARLRFGSDFFMYALTTNSQGLRLQVDAVDGYFGGHVAYRASADPLAFGARLRLMHLSAHFIDGHFDPAQNRWKDGRDPVPFTKDFGELTGAWSMKAADGTLMLYSGFLYATLIRPVEISRWSTLHGVEYRNATWAGTFLGKTLTVYGAYHLTVSQINAVIGTNNIECGVKFGEWDKSGVRFYGSYFAGMEIFSQYYNERTNYWGLGFALDVY